MIRRLFRIQSTPGTAELAAVCGILEKRYREQVDGKALRYDTAQVEALTSLQTLLENLLLYENSKRTFGFNKKHRRQQCRNIYLFGDVGRGKSMLMDLFYDNCPIKKKRRVHFHHFMLEVHEFMHNRQNGSDLLMLLAEKINTQASLLCFDEFHVIDATNAVILERLFTRLYQLGTVIVSTSNRHPDELYQGGITSDLFLSFIDRLKQSTDIIALNAAKDYRLTHAPAHVVYHTPIQAGTAALLQRHYQRLTRCSAPKPKRLTVMGRDIRLASAHGGIAWATFQELCEQPLGPADYLKIAGQFRALILSDIPRFGPERHDQAKRFSTLVDALYFHHAILICSAEAPAHELYDAEHGAFFMRRTVSRLIEMQSAPYQRISKTDASTIPTV